MNQHEYEFMTNQWRGVKGAAYNAVYGFCRGFGWMRGFDHEGRVVHTREGAKQVRNYQLDEKYKRIDVI